MNDRSYKQLCGVARALDVIGNRWTLLLVRNLLVGPLRYSELLETLPGITTNLLADRLKHLEAHGVVEKVGARPYAEYRLTPRGEALRSIILGLGEWGGACPMPKDGVGNLRWGLLSLTRTRRPSFEGCAQVQERGGREFFLLAKDGQLEIAERPETAVTVALEGAGPTFLALFFGLKPAAQLVASGALNLSGAHSAKQRWLTLLAPGN